jgi:hypothetical protein
MKDGTAMLLIIQGREYPAAAIEDLSITDLMAVKKQTGMDMAGMQELLTRLSERAPQLDSGAALDDDDLIGLALTVWIARRRAGEKSLTMEEAADFPLRELEFRSEPGDETEALAPNRGARRARAAKKPAAKSASSRTTKTSARRSGGASPRSATSSPQ